MSVELKRREFLSTLGLTALAYAMFPFKAITRKPFYVKHTEKKANLDPLYAAHDAAGKKYALSFLGLITDIRSNWTGGDLGGDHPVWELHVDGIGLIGSDPHPFSHYFFSKSKLDTDLIAASFEKGNVYYFECDEFTILTEEDGGVCIYVSRYSFVS